MAARKVARDTFAELPRRTQAAGGKTLLARMRLAASKAAKGSTQPGTTYTDEVRTLAEMVIPGASMTILSGTSANAATLTLFCVSIRDAPLKELADDIADIYHDIPMLAFQYGLDCLIASRAAESIRDAVGPHRGHQAAIRAAEGSILADVLLEAPDAVGRGAMKGIFSVLVAGAYATSKRDTFDAGYVDALAAACGAKLQKSREMAEGAKS